MHVLSNCSNAAALRRYTVRHNDILSLLVSWLTSVKSASQLLYADLSDTRVLPICDLFTNCRPDLAIVGNNSIHILELTVCRETNLISSHGYKSNKYKNISSRGSSKAGNRKIVPHFIEISTLWFISSCSDFTRAVKLMRCPLRWSTTLSSLLWNLHLTFIVRGTMLIRPQPRRPLTAPAWLRRWYTGRCTRLFYELMSRTANVEKGRAMQLADNLLLQYVYVLIAFKIKHCLIR